MMEKFLVLTKDFKNPVTGKVHKKGEKVWFTKQINRDIVAGGYTSKVSKTIAKPIKYTYKKKEDK